MTYITDTLAKDETLIATGSISKWSLFHVYFAALLFAISVVLLPLTGLLLLYAWLKIRSTEMGVTSKRVIRKSGVIMRDTSEIRLSKVESVSVNQGILGRMLGYGTVTIVGTGGNGAVMKGVKDPLAFRAQAQEAFERAQRISQKFEIDMSSIDLGAASGMSIDEISDLVAAAVRKQGGAA